MRLTILAAALLLAALVPSTAQAQRVSADILIGGYPVAGRVIIGDPHPRYYGPGYIHRVPARRIIVHRPSRVLVVHRGNHRSRWIRDCDCRPVRAWYDPHRRVYYDGYRSGLREVAVYERGGRYYGFDD